MDGFRGHRTVEGDVDMGHEAVDVQANTAVLLVETIRPHPGDLFCGLIEISRLASCGVSKIQTGLVYHYATWMIFGLVIIGLIFIDFAIPIISKGDTLYTLIKTSFFSLFSINF